MFKMYMWTDLFKLTNPITKTIKVKFLIRVHELCIGILYILNGARNVLILWRFFSALVFVVNNFSDSENFTYSPLIIIRLETKHRWYLYILWRIRYSIFSPFFPVISQRPTEKWGKSNIPKGVLVDVIFEKLLSFTVRSGDCFSSLEIYII